MRLSARLLSELFENSEVGDPDKTQTCLLFDEHMLLFDDAPKALVDKGEQVARLIASKGWGCNFINANTPVDVPEEYSLVPVGATRIQHAPCAPLPPEPQNLRLAAQTLVREQTPAFRELERKRSARSAGRKQSRRMLAEKGIPRCVERTMIPLAVVAALDPLESCHPRCHPDGAKPDAGKYNTASDRASAFEMLAKRQRTPRKEAAQVRKQARSRDNRQTLREFSSARYAGKRVTTIHGETQHEARYSFGVPSAKRGGIKELKGQPAAASCVVHSGRVVQGVNAPSQMDLKSSPKTGLIRRGIRPFFNFSGINPAG